MSDIAYEYDKYLKSIGADQYEEKANLMESYVKDLKQEIDNTVNQRKDLYKIVDELKELMENWQYGFNDLIDEMKEIDDKYENSI